VSETSSQTRSTPKSRWLGKTVFGILGLLGAVLVLFVATVMFGFHSGEEFAPDTFARRTFYFYEIPLLGIQVTPIVRDDTTNTLERDLRQYTSSPGPSDTRWDLVFANAPGAPAFRGDAAILCDYLDMADEKGALVWKKWSDQHPELAKVLWPLVVRVAGQQLYIFLPELLDLARSESDPKALSGELRAALARQYRQLAEIQQDLGEHDTALELLEEALTYAPNDSQVLRCRDRSLQALETRQE
jgi:hypothetical protein